MPLNHKQLILIERRKLKSFRTWGEKDMLLEKWNASILNIRDALTKCTNITLEQFDGAVHDLLSREQKLLTIMWLSNFDTTDDKEKKHYKNLIDKERKKLENYHVALRLYGDKSTEVYINCRLKRNIPKNVQMILKYMFGGCKASFNDTPQDDKISYHHLKLPEHPFFKTTNWRHIGEQGQISGTKRDDGTYPLVIKYNSYVECTNEISERKVLDRHLVSLSTIYDTMGECEKFFDWIDQYVYDEPCRFIGYYYNRMTYEPTMVFKKS